MITDVESRFTLIPVLEEGGGGGGKGPRLRAQELGIPLVREAKFDILLPDLAVRELQALEAQVEELEVLIREEKLEDADELAHACLSKVLQFPEHRPLLLRSWWVLPLLLLGLAGLAVLLLYLVSFAG